MAAATRTMTATRAPVPGRRLLAALGIWIGIATAVGAATALAARAIAPRWATAANLSAVIAAEVYAALVVVLLLVIGRPLGWRTPHRQDVLWGLAATAATWAAVAAVSLALWPLLGSLDGLFDALTFIGSDGGRLAVVGPVLAVLSVARAVVITPLAEELLFRGALYGWLRRWWPAWATTAATAAAFAAIHGSLVAVVPFTLVFGIVTGWLRERTGSVAAGFVAHVLNNATLVATTLLLTG
jgi:membrane protease YdiL (CAAX protease family)